MQLELAPEEGKVVMAGANMRLRGESKLSSPCLVGFIPWRLTMKRTVLMTAALLALTVGLASAQSGLNLGWLDCAGVGAGPANQTFACNSNTGANILIGS